ncbi:flavodoxin family protein [Lactiplantibacillus herbarum]|uniref:flavodoxin family protein n=1 Tax=Lactiplantibacillus herbarum TaxID=1670446 RepID=UPI00069D7C23|nr:flavodoxin [Lactiplantibacillus herbarum]
MTKAVLIVYYSWSQTTKRLAQALAAELTAKRVPADIVELTVAADTFSTDMYATSDTAKQQMASGQLPKLTNALPTLTDYQKVLVGGPVWGGQVATPVRTFLRDLHDFQGSIAPFFTDMGTAGDYEVDFKNLVPEVSVESGLEATRQLLSQTQKLQTSIEAWYAEIGLS